MDPKLVSELIALGPYGISTLLVLAVIFLTNHIIKLYKDKDDVRKEQIADTRIALEAVAKSTDNLNSAEERMVQNTDATKELLAVTRSLLNKGQI